MWTDATKRVIRHGLGAIALGALLAVAITSLTALVTYYPVGAYLLKLPGYGFILALLGLYGMAAIMAPAGIALAAIRRSWRPLATTGAAIIGLMVGQIPAFWLYDVMTWHGYELVSERSAHLISAIEAYDRVNGKPPETLSQLIPTYLQAIPSTGMPLSPGYEYSAAAIYCADGNRWELSMRAGDFISFDTFFYCPLRDYSPSLRIVGNWAYYFE